MKKKEITTPPEQFEDPIAEFEVNSMPLTHMYMTVHPSFLWVKIKQKRYMDSLASSNKWCNILWQTEILYKCKKKIFYKTAWLYELNVWNKSIFMEGYYCIN